jgi:hypothetical protein
MVVIIKQTLFNASSRKHASEASPAPSNGNNKQRRAAARRFREERFVCACGGRAQLGRRGLLDEQHWNSQ